MKSDIASLSFEIDILHAFYEKGASAKAIVTEVYRRIAAVSDPGIFIHLRNEIAVTEEADALPPFDPETYPLWGGRLPSRIILILPAHQPQRPVLLMLITLSKIRLLLPG